MKYAVILKTTVPIENKILILQKYKHIAKRACIKFVKNELRLVFGQFISPRSAQELLWDLEENGIVCEVVEL